MKNWIKRITGFDELERAAQKAARDAEESSKKRLQEENALKKLKKQKLEAEKEAEEARKKSDFEKLSAKEQADILKEPWVSVLDVKINKDNIRNGFFELDWNSYFIKELIQFGYGSEADPEEEIVDRWFRTIVYQMLEAEGLDTERGAGYINVTALSGGKSEVR